MVLAPMSPPVIPAHYAEVFFNWFRFEDTYLVVVISAFLGKEHIDGPLLSMFLQIRAPDTWFHLQCDVQRRKKEGLSIKLLVQVVT